MVELVFEHETIDGILKINVLDNVHGFSVEDSPQVMSAVIDKILQVKRVERIILAERMEHEYGFDQTRILVEISNLYDQLLSTEIFVNPERLANGRCVKCLPNAKNEMKLVLEMIKGDPIGAYVKTRRLRRLYNVKSQSLKEGKTCQRCFKMYVDNVLTPIIDAFEKTELIDLVKENVQGYSIGDRSFYREIFSPLIRPLFMLTRYMALPPSNGRLMTRYESPGNVQVEIYKIPGEIRYFYHISPPEFRLSDERYSILDTARRYVAEHKPGEAELAAPEQARESFMNLGRDIIRQVSNEVGIKLSAKELERLSEILVRHTAGFGVLEVLLIDENLQDIYINSPIGITPIYVLHNDFEECQTNLIPTKEDAERWATRFRLLSERPLDEANPVLDTDLFVPGGRARVAAITRSLSPEGLAYALRRHRDRPWTYPLFINTGYFDTLFAGLMSFLVDGSRTILFAGGRSSGKTSLLNATILEMMRKNRIVVVEDTLEIGVPQLREMGYNIERMKSRSVITRVEAELPAEEALRVALRLGDSVLIIGEVRSKEAQALYEAMRIGALANVVAGTIHGESAYGVFDRVVNDLGVPPTSFKATDIIVIAGMIKSADGLHRFRRVLEVVEVRKHWKEDPMEEKGFIPLMEYSAREDKLKPTETLLNGESQIINEIAKRVREWHGRWDAVWSNIELRSNIKQAMVDYSHALNRKDILEAEWVSSSNEMFHMISDEVKKDLGDVDSEEVFRRWDEWFKNKLKAAK